MNSRWLRLWLFAGFFLATPALAQPEPPPPSTPSCDALAAELGEAKRQLEEGKKSSEQTKQADARLAICLTKGDSMERQVESNKVTLSVVEGVTSFLMGETDSLPELSAAHGANAERSLLRLLGAESTRGPARGRVYRRLLVEALGEVAPRAKERLQKESADHLDEFFAKSGHLDAPIVAEVRERAFEARDEGSGGTHLGRALRLVQAFQIVAGCGGKESPPECKNAEEMEELLSSSGPLVLRYRAQRIWETPCDAIDSDVFLSWVQDVPVDEGEINGWREVTDAAANKIYVCFLEHPETGPSFSSWLTTRLPPPAKLSARSFARVDAVAAHFAPGSEEDTCAKAARALQNLPETGTCSIDSSTADTLEAYAEKSAAVDGQGFALEVCGRFTRMLFAGEVATIPDRFESVPPADKAVKIVSGLSDSKVEKLRAACSDRRGGAASFPVEIARIARVAQLFGEPIGEDPWRLGPTLVPLELARRSEGGRTASGPSICWSGEAHAR